MSRGAGGESVMERVVRIVEVFRADRPVLGVSEISRITGLHVATVSRHVDALVTAGWLQRDQQRRVSPGVRLWEVASRSSAVTGLREAAMPVMEDLRTLYPHHVQLGVMEDRDVLFVERLSATTTVTSLTHVAGRLPLHASSTGLVLLAFAPPAVQDAMLDGPLPSFTTRTITDPTQLRRVLAQVRVTGHVVCAGHIAAGACSVGVPVRGPAGEVVAALSLVMPDDGTAHRCVPVLQAAGLEIGRSLDPTGARG